MSKIYKAFIKTTKGYKLYAITDNKKYINNFKDMRKDKMFKYKTIEVDEREAINILNMNRGEVLDIYSFMTSEVNENNKIIIVSVDVIIPYNEYMVVSDNVEHSADVLSFEDFWESSFNYPYSVYKKDIIKAMDVILYTGLYNIYSEMDETPVQYAYKDTTFASSYDELGVFLKLFKETLK